MAVVCLLSSQTDPDEVNTSVTAGSLDNVAEAFTLR